MMLLRILLATLILAVGVSSQHLQGAELRDDSDTFQTLPRRALVKPGGSITILGTADTPLQSCQFYLPWPRSKWSIDFSKGAKSNYSDPRYEYFGKGLEFGECGMRIKRVGDDDDGIIQCEVLPAGSDVAEPDAWEKCATTLRVTNIRETELPVFDIEPSRNLIRLARGDDLTIRCNADRALNLCHIYLPGPRFLNLDNGVNTSVTTEYRYHGNGLDKGECGATLTNVDERLTGYVVCKVGRWPESLNGKWETDSFQVITTEFITTPFTENGTEDRPTIKNPNATACPPLTSKSADIRCFFAGKLTDCSLPQKIRSEAYIDCKPGFTKPSRIIYKKIRCLKGGIWEPRPITCQPDCGRRITNQGLPTASNGEDSMIGEFPWHVGIYQKVDRTPVQACGGSLIAEGLVVSAAHCFWGSDRLLPASLFKVAAGNHLRQWKHKHSWVQKRDVLEILVGKDYRGRGNNYNSDIALVRLKKPFKITNMVNLICVDWNHNFEQRHLAAGSEGIVTGWGFTENGTQSDILQYLGLPYRTREMCLETLNVELQQLLTEDKFCAGFINKSKSVCRGDSGGGLVFREPRSNKYYLRGVVSVAFISNNEGVCNMQDYTGFTKFDQYLEWVQDNLNFDYSSIRVSSGNSPVQVNDNIVFPRT